MTRNPDSKYICYHSTLSLASARCCSLRCARSSYSAIRLCVHRLVLNWVKPASKCFDHLIEPVEVQIIQSKVAEQIWDHDSRRNPCFVCHMYHANRNALLHAHRVVAGHPQVVKNLDR